MFCLKDGACFRSMGCFLLLCTGIYRRYGLSRFQLAFVLLVLEKADRHRLRL